MTMDFGSIARPCTLARVDRRPRAGARLFSSQRRYPSAPSWARCRPPHAGSGAWGGFLMEVNR